MYWVPIEHPQPKGILQMALNRPGQNGTFSHLDQVKCHAQGLLSQMYFLSVKFGNDKYT